MTKPIKMWAIKTPRGVLHSGMPIQRTRRKAISALEMQFRGSAWKWTHLYRYGYRCVRVEVREIEG